MGRAENRLAARHTDRLMVYAINLSRRVLWYLVLLIVASASAFFLVRYSHEPNWHFYLILPLTALPLVLLGGWLALTAPQLGVRILSGALAAGLALVTIAAFVLYLTGHLSFYCYSFVAYERVC